MNKRKQRRDKIARLISWGHWFTFFNILLVLAIGTLYIEASEMPETALGLLYLIVNWLGHFAFLPFITFIILLFPFCLLVPYARILRGIATLVASLGLIALVADALFYRNYGYHLNTYSLSQLATDAESIFAGASFLILLGMLLTFVILLVFELALANLAWKRLDKLREKHWGASFSAVFVLCFLSSHSIHVWADAVFYTPITKQDDMFPLSYPTTAKTLMSKHGLLVEQRTEATQQLIRSGTSIQLRYPTRELQCARVPEAPNTLVVAIQTLNTNSLHSLQNEVPELVRFNSTVIGHPTTDSGIFELIYALPDLYETPINHANKLPVYLSTLLDYRIDVTINNQSENVSLPRAFDAFSGFNLAQPNAILGIAIADQVTSEIIATIKNHLHRNTRIFVVGVSPTATQTQEPFAPQAMQVALLHSPNVQLQAQPMVMLTDIMPTVLSSYMSCVDDAKAYAIGLDLLNDEQRLPLLTSFGQKLVVYDEDMTSIINADASIRTFSNSDLKLLPGVSPATPVLVDGIRKLKRFSGEHTEHLPN